MSAPDPASPLTDHPVTGRRVIVVAGPSGAGKSRLSERLGLPVLRLDDFYREIDAPGLPRIHEGANAGMVDWDHPDSWDHDLAVEALLTLCRTGATEVPVYDISLSARTGSRVVDLGDARHFVAEGIFAARVVEDCRDLGILLDAYCVTQHPAVTFWRRLTRDLRERRKPPLVLVRRGWALMRAQPAVVEAAVRLGCRPATGDQAYAELVEELAHT
ncbi:MAG: uridine kinase [Nocardioides sp.]|uniref:uridine kinase family protein n=1 Tax=Nocardioides sp. TaxID=35761 RepID=UPI003EFF4F85